MIKEYITVNIKSLKPYKNNPRKNDEAVPAVQESIKQCGYITPIVVDENLEIMAGNTRYKALLGNSDEIKVLQVSGLTDEQKRKYRLLDNKVGEAAQWDFDKLELELDGLDFDGFDFGFDVDLPSLEEDDQKEVVEDDYDEEPPTEPKAKLGDLWQLGNYHRLICGDSTDPAVIDRLMDGVKADMVFTDPPYGYNYQSNMRTKSEKFDVLENDDKILDFFPNLLGRVKGFVMICTTWKVLDKWLPLFKQYFDLSNMIIWDKGGGYIGDLKHTFGTDYEIILCSNNNAEIKGKRIGSVWSIGKDKESDYEHPTQKPVELSATAISSTTEHGNIVLDCFGGSGSTLIACEQLNRKCYMCELDPKYVSVIVQRWLNLTGRKDEIFCIRDGQKLIYDDIFN